MRCLIFCVAGDERVELPSAVLESGTFHFLTHRKTLKPLVLLGLSILHFNIMRYYFATFRVNSPQIVPNFLN